MKMSGACNDWGVERIGCSRTPKGRVKKKRAGYMPCLFLEVHDRDREAPGTVYGHSDGVPRHQLDTLGKEHEREPTTPQVATMDSVGEYTDEVKTYVLVADRRSQKLT